MTKLQPGELMAFQIVVAPTFPEEILKISHMILHNENVLRYLNRTRPPWYLNLFVILLQQSIKFCEMVLRETMQTITEIFFANTSRERLLAH